MLRSRTPNNTVHLTDAGIVSRWHSGVTTSTHKNRDQWKLSRHIFMAEAESLRVRRWLRVPLLAARKPPRAAKLGAPELPRARHLDQSRSPLAVRYMQADSSNATSWPELHVMMRIARKPWNYVWETVLPCSCISLLSLSSMVIPSNHDTSGGSHADRFAIIFIGVLTFFNFRETVNDGLPKVAYQTAMDVCELDAIRSHAPSPEGARQHGEH